MIYCSIPSDKTKVSEQSFWELPIDEVEKKQPLNKDQVKNILDFYSSANGNRISDNKNNG